MCQNLVAIFKFNLEHCIWQLLYYGSFNFNYVCFAQKRKGIKLAAGMTLAIEPMITAGRYDVAWMDDGWTVVTEDGSLASHYENTILITDGDPEILSL